MRIFITYLRFWMGRLPPSQSESNLMQALLANARPIWHWVIDSQNGPIAYVCYTPAYRERRPIGFHLAPVAVHPKHQNKGLGSLLIRGSLSQPPLADKSVFVLGDPQYYARFGFRGIRQPECPFDPGNPHFMALRYEGEDEFTVGYEPAGLQQWDSR